MLFMHLVSANGIPFAIGLLLILGGIIIMSITLMVMQRVPDVSVLLYLGLVCLNAGFWGFCSNDLAIYLIPAPNLLYVGSAVGLLFCAVSFLRYGTEALKPHHRMPVVATYTAMRAVFLLALILHIMGIYSFSYSLAALQLVSLVAIAAFGFFALYEFVVYRNPQARSLGIPCIALTACALVSIVNCFVPFMRPESLLLQVGIVIFVGWTAVVGWFFIRTALDEAERSAQLELEVAAMNRSLDMQRTLYNRLSQSTEEVRALRHDLRHQLQAIRGYLQKDNVTGALGYVDAISGTIPEIANKLLCDNFAVNAVAVHYLDKATEAHIQTDLRLVVPEDLGQIHDNDMSIIVGNLFENAIEACLFVDEDKRFIRMSSKVVKRRLTLVIDNSFDGTYTEKGGEFYSRKRQGKGVGISSVRAVVERYGGSLKYEVANGVFMTSLYVKM
jgi:FtsH-binding integral membrane protein